MESVKRRARHHFPAPYREAKARVNSAPKSTSWEL
jgi:hypothetical protein